MMPAARRRAITGILAAHVFRIGIVLLTLSLGALLLTALSVHAWPQNQPRNQSQNPSSNQSQGHLSNPQPNNLSGPLGGNTSFPGHVCDDMGASMAGMSVMGASMGAMTNHMCITPLRQIQPGDVERAKAVVAQVKAAIEKYKDYKKALADGYVIGNPKVVQLQYHFTNNANVRLADTQFDPTRPSSLLYYRSPTQQYRLEGVMFTDSTSATEDELNQRIPLSIARWHEHTNFCGAPASKVKEYFGDHPKFGMFGSIHTRQACDAEGGTFFPIIFSWMIHVFPYEDNLKGVFSMDDDIPHFH